MIFINENVFLVVLYLKITCIHNKYYCSVQSYGAHTLRAVLREAGRLAGRQGLTNSVGNALESTPRELKQAG